MSEWVERYGPWALVAGGAKGIGEAYSRHLAAKGLNLVVIDADAEALGRFAVTVAREYGVECLPLAIDLARSDLLASVTDAIGGREMGMLVYNAGLADVGPFYKAETGLDHELKKIAINVTGPLVLTYHFARGMLARRRGGIILMSSGAGLQGSPYYAHYSATKAYDTTLAEALWREFSPYAVDVLACVAGMTLSSVSDAYAHLDRSTFQTPDELVEEAMAALGRQPTLIANAFNRKGQALLRDLPREQRIEIMARHAIDNFLDGAEPAQNI